METYAVNIGCSDTMDHQMLNSMLIVFYYGLRKHKLIKTHDVTTWYNAWLEQLVSGLYDRFFHTFGNPAFIGM